MIILLTKVFRPGRKDLLRSILFFTAAFGISLSFFLYVLVLYDSEILDFNRMGFDYILTDFSEDGVKDLREREDVEGLYPLRLISAPVGTGAELNIYLAGEWDREGLSFLSTKRAVAGRAGDLSEGSIVMDILTARSLRLKTGDTVSIRIGKSGVIKRRLDMLLEPENVLMSGAVVMLMDDGFRKEWLANFGEEPEYSVMFLKGSGKELENYLYRDYCGPLGKDEGPDERRQIARSTVIKKDWLKADAGRNFLFTPPAAIAVCALSVLLSVFLVRRESKGKAEKMRRRMQTLVREGMNPSKLRICLWAFSCLFMSGCGAAAGLVVKYVVFDCFFPMIYLPLWLLWRTVGGLMLMILTVSFTVFGKERMSWTDG